jgi:hypothetical protein
MAPNESTSFLGIVARLFWMMIGPAVLAVLAYNIVNIGSGWLTPVDYGYLAILAAVGLARWFEFHCGNPQTAQGEPATPEHLRRYLLGLFGVGLLIWIVANVVGNYLLSH